MFDINLLTDELTLIDVYATWCGPCKMISPNIEKAVSINNIKLIKVDIDDNLLFANKYNINSIPTLLLFKNKKLISTIVGYKDLEELSDWINSYK